MKIRDFALTVVETGDLDTKLEPPPPGLTDEDPVPPRCPDAPGRPDRLRIVPGPDSKVPALEGLADPAQRPRILHALANHELQAVELFAWALLRFPDAPPKFRAGLLRVLADEQRHTRLYRRRLNELGCDLGDHPVSGYFWNKIDTVTSPREFVCAMSLTFENANLDHATETAAVARRSGDEATARLMETVHRDEIRHVAFGWEWLGRFRDPDASMWDAYRDALHWPLRPARARGERFHREGREAAGLDPEFIDRLEATPPAPPFARSRKSKQ